jgi:hypothetical protein
MLGEANALGGESVEFRGGDELLTVAAKVAITQVVSQYEDDIGFGGGSGSVVAGVGIFGACGEEQQRKP